MTYRVQGKGHRGKAGSQGPYWIPQLRVTLRACTWVCHTEKLSSSQLSVEPQSTDEVAFCCARGRSEDDSGGVLMPAQEPGILYTVLCL